MSENVENRPTPKPPAVRADGSRRFLRTGAYLYTTCPVCRGNMIEGGWIRFKAIDAAGHEGELRLSPRFNVFDKQSTIPLQPGLELRDLLCPRCGTSLVTPNRQCEVCSSKTVRIRIRVVDLEIGLYICTRTGCFWHGISEEDQQRVALENQDS